MSIEEILAALRAILDAAEGRDLTDEEVSRYEQLEEQLVTTRRSVEIRARQKAYETPVRSDLHVHVGNVRQDDTLDRAFNHYLRTGVANQDLTELRAQSTTDSAGGYMIPPGFRQKLVEVQKAYGGLANEVEVITTESGNALEYPSLDDTANSGSITAESSAFADGADLVFGTVNLGAFKYTSQGTGTNLPLRVSVELLQDSAFDVQGLVSRALGTRIARKQAVDWATGGGTTLPFGIAHSGLTDDNALASAGTITYQDLLDTEALLDPVYEQNARWVMSKGTWSQIRAITDVTTGRPLVLENAVAGMGQNPPKMLLGYEVVIDMAMPAVTGSNYFAILGDLREAYVIRRVQNLVVVVNPYSRANFGQVEYVAWERADGNIQNRSAYVILANQ